VRRGSKVCWDSLIRPVGNDMAGLMTYLFPLLAIAVNYKSNPSKAAERETRCGIHHRGHTTRDGRFNLTFITTYGLLTHAMTTAYYAGMNQRGSRW
jgi:hypothetical protein